MLNPGDPGYAAWRETRPPMLAINALAVMLLDDKIKTFLQENDPQAFKQAKTAYLAMVDSLSLTAHPLIRPDVDNMDADALNDYLASIGMNWSEVTNTDPASVDPVTQGEIDLVRDYLRNRP